MQSFVKNAFAFVGIASIAAASVVVGSGSAIAQTPEAPATGAPIPIFQMAPVDSPVVSLPGYPQGAKVAVAAINAAGGINGRPLALTFCDDKLSNATAASCVDQAAANGAVARVSSIGLQGAVVQPLLSKNEIVDFGAVSASTADFQSPNSYPLSPASYFYAGAGQLARQKFPKAKTFVLVVTGVGTNVQRSEMMRASYEKAGFKMIERIVIPAGTADLSSIAGQLKSDNPDVVGGIMSALDLPKYWSATQSVGFTKPLFQGTSGVTPAILSSAGAANAWTNWITFYPSYLGAVPGSADFRKQMAAYAPGQALTPDAWNAWVGVQTFASIIKSIKGPITNKTVLGTVSRVKCLTVLYFKCLNFTKPGPIAEAPAIRVGTIFLNVARGSDFYPTKYSASIFG